MPWIVLRLLAVKARLAQIVRNLPIKPVGVGIFVSLFLLVQPSSARAASLNTDTFIQFLADIAFGIASVLAKAIALLIDVLIPIMTFNNFVGNPVVTAGWAILRDTVNMFFVVVLIIIAFGTIFGHQKFKWQQQVPRLLIFAIVINFSKTLCGIMIDFGQVIMLTFANALREVAAGNFIQLLGLNQIYQGTSVGAFEEGMKAFDFLAGAVMSVMLTMSVLSLMIVMVAILLFRIVMLWVLVTIAPLAWFMGGVAGEGGFIQSDAYKEWWKEFKCLVGVGPILTFFLWLTLVVAGTGRAAADSGFDVESTNNANFVNAIFDLDNFLSFLIGMALLMAGLKAAASFCGQDFKMTSPSQRVGQMLGAARALPGAAAGTSARLAGLGLRGTPAAMRRGRQAMGDASRYLPPSISQLPSNVGGAVRTGMWGAVAKVPGLNRYGTDKKLAVAQEQRAQAFEGVEREKEDIGKMDRDRQKALIESYNSNPPTSERGKDRAAALFETMMGDKRLQKELGPDAVERLWQTQGARYKDLASGNAEKTANIEGFEKANADFVLKGQDAQGKQAWLNKNLESADDVKSLGAKAWENQDVQAHTGKITTSFKGKDGKMLTALEAARAGRYGLEAQKAALKESPQPKGEAMDHKRRQVEMALAGGDKDRAHQLIGEMGAEFHNAQDPDQKAELLSVMDNTIGMLQDSGDSGANSVLKRLTQVRDTAERVSPPPPPEKLTEGQSGKAYASGMKNASAGRKANAVNRLYAQENASRKEIDQTQVQRDTLIGERKSSIEAELSSLAESLAQTRSAIDKELTDKTEALHTQWKEAVTKKETTSQKAEADKSNPQMMSAWKEESAKAAQAAAQEEESLRRQLAEARRQSGFGAQRQRVVEGDERVKKLQIEIDTKANQLKNFNPEEVQAVKDLTTKIESLKEQIVQSKIARNQLR